MASRLEAFSLKPRYNEFGCFMTVDGAGGSFTAWYVTILIHKKTAATRYVAAVVKYERLRLRFGRVVCDRCRVGVRWTGCSIRRVGFTRFVLIGGDDLGDAYQGVLGC